MCSFLFLMKVIKTTDTCVSTFLSELNNVACSGEEFEMSERLRLLAMDSISQTSFGLVFNVQKTKQVPDLIKKLEHFSARQLAKTTEFIASMSLLVQLLFNCIYISKYIHMEISNDSSILDHIYIDDFNSSIFFHPQLL